MTTLSNKRVWFVTGAGRGLGRAFVDAALQAGDQVVATVRRPGALDALVREHRKPSIGRVFSPSCIRA